MDPNDQNPISSGDQGVPTPPSDQGGQVPDTGQVPPTPEQQTPPEEGTGEISPPPPVSEPETQIPDNDSQGPVGGQEPSGGQSTL